MDASTKTTGRTSHSPAANQEQRFAGTALNSVAALRAPAGRDVRGGQ